MADNTVTTPRTLTYVTTADLGISSSEAYDVASALDVSYGDALLTLVHPDAFQAAVEDALDLTRGAKVRDKLLALKINYVAFIG